MTGYDVVPSRPVERFRSSDVMIWQGDARTAWRHLPERSADALVTSPPYYGLRDYGVDGQIGLEASRTPKHISPCSPPSWSAVRSSRPSLSKVCRGCGQGRERLIERIAMVVRAGTRAGGYGSRTTDGITGTMLEPALSRTVGWSDCGHGAGWSAGTVIDPFAGSGTTGLMARRLGRRAVLVELNGDYCDLAAGGGTRG